jgi:hypothetical protein
MFEKDHAIQTVQGLMTYHRVASAVHRDPTHPRQVIACIWPAPDGCLSAGCIRWDARRQEIKPRLVHQHDGAAFDLRLFLRWGQPWGRHGPITAASRWVARSIGIWGVQCQRFKNRETWALWDQTPHASPITVATRAQVQHSPRKP